jgi:hypothetical protein
VSDHTAWTTPLLFLKLNDFFHYFNHASIVHFLQLTNTMAAAFPPGGTFFDTVKKTFVDVPVDASKDNAISTTEFLEAAESLTTLFGRSGISSVHDGN